MVAFVYIVADKRQALEVGLTLSLMRTMWVRKTDFAPRSRRPGIRLLYFERCSNIRAAHQRHQELAEAGDRVLRRLVRRRNPLWRDLSDFWFPATLVEPPVPTHALVALSEREAREPSVPS